MYSKQKIGRLIMGNMISNILNNDVYCGNLRTHKKKTISIRGRAIKLPEEEPLFLKIIMKQ